MSSPIALNKKGNIRKALIHLHQKHSHNHRISILSKKIAELIREQIQSPGKIRCLDVGCGDMQIAETVSMLNPNTKWDCIDLYDLPENIKIDKKWSKYQKFDGIHFPFADKSIDVVLFCDVLHHASDVDILLKEAVRVSNIIIIKDHFEYSLYSRLMLKLMDFVGNWGYGVKIPKKYYTSSSFRELCNSLNLVDIKIDINIALYPNFVLRHLLRAKWQFIAVLGSRI